MNTEVSRETISRALERVRVSRGLSTVFGDSGGIVVFLAAVVFLGGLWRVDFILNDSVTVGNLLVNVADGRLAVTDAPYALTVGEQPGLVEVDGERYGRNYGQVYLAVPILWLLDAVSGLLDLRLLLAAGWSLSLLGLARACARLLDRPVVADAGALLALVAFAGSMAVATEIGWLDHPRPVVALGLSTLLLAAVAATILYRLLSWAHGRRVGLAGGLGLVLATPIGFWGSFPKRHVLSATALLVVCYFFAVSRTETDRRATLARAGAYAMVGFLASVHAYEAAFALAVLLPIDLLTAPSNDRRTLAVVVVVFSLATVPMLATNAAISGDPLQPPRALPGADGGGLSMGPVEEFGGGGGGGGGGGSDSGGAGGGGDSGPSGLGGPFADLVSMISGILDRIAWIATNMLGSLSAGLAAITQLDRFHHVFVRSGWIPGVQYHRTGFETLELAFVEVLPLAGALLCLPVLLVRRARASVGSTVERLRTGLDDPVRQTDLLVGCLALTFLLVYMPLLPVYAMITLRYVVPVMPLVLYAVCRLPPVRAAIAETPRLLVAAFLGTIALGGLAFWAVLVVLEPAQGETLQLHALVGLAASVVAAGVVTSWHRHRRTDVVAFGLAVGAGATTLLIVFAGLVYFADGNHALDLVRLVAETLPAVG